MRGTALLVDGFWRASPDHSWRSFHLRESAAFDLAEADAWLDALFVQLALPLLWRGVGDADDGADTMVATGDIGLRAKLSLGWGLAVPAGLSLPTAPVIASNGRRVPIEAQPGTGSIDPALGLSWSASDRDIRPRAFGASAWGVWPTGDANPQLRLTTHGQRALWREGEKAIALRLMLEGRSDGRTYEDDTPVAHSGGFIAHAGLDLAIAPATDWQLELRHARPGHQRPTRQPRRSYARDRLARLGPAMIAPCGRCRS